MLKRAQSTNEYALVIVVVTLAAVAMQAHIKRGIQAVIKLTADDLVTQSTTVPVDPVVPADGRVTESGLHLSAKEYKDINGGSVWGERQGNVIYYYHFTSNPEDKTLIGIEDTLTGDYTEFGADGFAIGVANKDNVNYDLKFIRNEDAKTYETTSVTVQEKIVSEGKVLYSDIGTYEKYERVRLSSGAIGEASIQQKGIEEPGLYYYKQTIPLEITNNPSVHPGVQPKTVTVTEFASSSATISFASYHPYIQSNFKKTEVTPEIKGNNVNYYDIATGSLIGIEDALTLDFTLFDKDGFVDTVLDKNGSVYDLELTENKDAGKVVSVTIKNKKDGKIIGTYGKYEPVRIGAVSTSSPFLGADKSGVPVYKARETVSNEKTNMSGRWEATYKLGTDIYKPKPKPQPQNHN